MTGFAPISEPIAFAVDGDDGRVAKHRVKYCRAQHGIEAERSVPMRNAKFDVRIIELRS